MVLCCSLQQLVALMLLQCVRSRLIVVATCTFEPVATRDVKLYLL